MIYGRIVLVAAAFSSVLFCRSTLGASNQPEVKGTITDATGAGVIGASVVFTGEGRTHAVETARDGSYLAELQAGTYDVNVKATGFCEMRHGSFIAGKDAIIELDFHLIVCPSDWTGKFYYAQLDAAPNSGLRPVILFGDANSSNNLTRYTGPVIPDIVVGKGKSPGSYGQYPQAVLKQRTYPVVLSYNLLTVRCRQLLYDSQKHLAIGTGQVEVQEGNGTRTGDRVRVFLSGLDPRLEIN